MVTQNSVRIMAIGNEGEYTEFSLHSLKWVSFMKYLEYTIAARLVWRVVCYNDSYPR